MPPGRPSEGPRPRAGTQPPPRAGALTERRVLFALALAFLNAGCGGDDVRTPTAPTPTTPSAPVAQSLDIVGAPPGGLVVGYEVDLQARLTYSNGAYRIVTAEWTSSAPALASIDADGTLDAHAAGVVTVTARAEGLTTTATVEIRPPGPDETFWRQLAFNDYECGRPEKTCDDLAQRVLWRLPTPSPNFLVREDSLAVPDLVDIIRETIPRAVPQLTGVPYTGRVETAPQGAPEPSGGNWIVIEGVVPQETPTSPACRNIGTESYVCGKAYIGRERGCIILNTHTRSCLTPSLIMHEVGHALGFYHTPNAVDIMHPSALANQSAVFSPLEQYHGAFAYTQRRGATYAEIALGAFGPRRPGPAPSPFQHGGIAVD